MAFLIRQATVAEIPALNQLVQASISRLGRKYYSPQQIKSSLKHLFSIDTQVVVDGTYFAVEETSQLVACGGWSRRKTPFGGDQASDQQNHELRDPELDPAVIRAFFVHPDWVRKGIGKLLLNHCENEAKKEGFGWFELTATLSGYPLYLRYGYRTNKKIKVKLADSTELDFVKMEKRSASN